MSERVDSRSIAKLENGITMRLIKSSDMGHKVGDRIKYQKTMTEFKERSGRYNTYIYGSGIIEAIYPYYFLIDVGKYKTCVLKTEVLAREGRRVLTDD